ncbi:MAG: ABC transporter permease [Acidimicrobiia bacterium]|nr:ABC transporter permease [Acidimicrobiia bacterium]
MKAVAIAAVSLRRFFRDRSNIFSAFLFPVILVLLLGSMQGGASNPRLGFNAETPDDLSAGLLDGLEAVEGFVVIEFDSEAATVRAVERGEIEAGLIVPAGFAPTLQAGGDIELRYVSRAKDGLQGIETAIRSVVARQSTLLRTARFAEQQGAGSFEDALAMAAEAQISLPPVEVVATSAGEPFALAGLGQFDIWSQTTLVLFIFLTTLQGAAALVQSRRYGVTRRMISTPTSVRTVLFGEGLSRLAIALVQGIVVFVGTWLIFGVDWGNPLLALLVLVMFAIVSSGAAMLLGAVASNDQQAGSLGTMFGLGLAALGGAMFPLAALEFLSTTVWRVAHITPHAWALEAFEELVAYNGGFAEIAGFLAILAGYAVVFFALGTWRLRAVLTR